MSTAELDTSIARSADASSIDRPSGTIWLWAGLGLAVIGLMIHSWGGWLTDGSTGRPSPGADHYDFLWALRGTEIVSTGVFFGLLWWSLINPLIRQRGLTFDGKLFLAGFFVSSLDVLYASLNPTWAMNAHAVSLGTWSEHMPLFANPGQDENAWGLLWCLPAYIWLGLGAAVVGTAILNGLRRRYSGLSTAGLYLITLTIFYVVFALVENFWLRTQVYDYVSVPRDFTLWAGQIHQFPVYSPLLISFYCLGYTWLRDSRDANDRCAVDRDVDKLNIGPVARAALSLLAITGFAATTTILGYQVPWSLMSMKGDSFPVLPSYLRPGENCGQPGTPLCTSQYLYELRHHPSELPTVK